MEHPKKSQNVLQAIVKAGNNKSAYGPSLDCSLR